MSDQMNFKTPSLLFTMALPAKSTNNYLSGSLKLINVNGSVANEYIASSSKPGMQYWASWRERGGVIPPNEPYRTALVPSQSNLDGIRGNFYEITPYEIKTIGVTRAAFGIHADPNRAYALGSLGCIQPITDRGWAAYQRDLRAIAKDFGSDLESIPLVVNYTHLG